MQVHKYLAKIFKVVILIPPSFPLLLLCFSVLSWCALRFTVPSVDGPPAPLLPPCFRTASPFVSSLSVSAECKVDDDLMKVLQSLKTLKKRFAHTDESR